MSTTPKQIPIEQKHFTKLLIKWNNSQNHREMPWKGEKDPYKIWLSEIILQQTRVEQGWAYYLKFVENFPVIEALATAKETKVFKLWEGLGYYSRCKNLIATAKIIQKDYQGKFPADYHSIINLKGIGPYTAAAIASFAFNLPFAVVDGNVFRVLSRYFGISTYIDSSEGKKYFNELAQALLLKSDPARYNQALMDFGATICKPQQPSCTICPLKKHCIAFKQNAVTDYPQKLKKIQKKNRHFIYWVAEYQGKTYLSKREKGDIWENLYEFILTEQENNLELNEKNIQKLGNQIFSGHEFKTMHVSKIYKQLLSHQTIYGRFICIQLKAELKTPSYKGYSLEKLRSLPFPKIISNYLKEKMSINLA